METIVYKANSRGYADHGWLKAFHSFSFADYYNPERMQFGALRVLNDDTIAPSAGFGMHPHDNMEIITIIHEGELRHEDNMGNMGIIKAGDIQVMSAGSGVFHSEYNNSRDTYTKLFQIWIRPNIRNVEPRYDQFSLNISEPMNHFHQIVSPFKNDAGTWIYQNAWLHMGHFNAGEKSVYNLKEINNSVFIIIIDGHATIENTDLEKRDAIGITGAGEINLSFSETTKLLIIEQEMPEIN